MNLCKYQNALGVPGKGIHSWRIGNFALADIIMTFIGAWLISFFFKLPYIRTLIILFITGIILHRLFCVPTTIDKLLFPDMNK